MEVIRSKGRRNPWVWCSGTPLNLHLQGDSSVKTLPQEMEGDEGPDVHLLLVFYLE